MIAANNIILINYFDFVARKGQKIGFDIDDEFLASDQKFVVKISYMDIENGEWSLIFQGKKGIEKRSLKNSNTAQVKTASFFINADFQNKELYFDLEIHGEKGFEPTISFVRIIKLEERE